MVDAFIEWLIQGAAGPAVVSLPVNWTAAALSGAAQRWFRRLRRTDDLSRLVKAATGTTAGLARAEFDAVRQLLSDQQTWTLLGHGTVEKLAARIADCLPVGDGRTGEDSRTAALTIARGLLEFAVADLDPKVFQRVLLARLQRMETGQASALDEAMFGLHADLNAGFAGVMGELKRVLDRLPPDPAQRGAIAAYLATLIDWLSSDPWPQDRRFGGPVLTPAAIERKLRVTATRRDGEQDLDADDLAGQCQRLVILGGPGAGKTWLAKRAARRCAEDALEALAAGGALDEVELPLYTTCSRLSAADGDIRQAAVSSALDQLGDLGGSRFTGSLRVFFTERNAPTVLIVDSLDEAHGSDERLRQADTLPWRVVLTSRPSSWNQQLGINAKDDSHRVGELQPLRYPDDVEVFIQRWFGERPAWGKDLAAQIAMRPGLQLAATVPLILAFYCIVGGGEPLPEFRRDLYTRVIRRMLTGRWRGSDDRQPDVEACLRTLRVWAWSGASSHPVSGVGTWADDILAERGALAVADEEALDHVATPLSPPDVDTGKTCRRFIHRSIREHLVAEHVAGLGVDQAVEVLLPHIWYDPDWEYSAPAALATHPQHDQLLRDLIRRAAMSDQIPGDLSVVDAGREWRGLLSRIALESTEADWSPEVAGMIGQARVDLARSARIEDVGGAASWRASNRRAREALLGLLVDQTRGGPAAHLVRGVVQLVSTAEEKRQVRDELLRLLAFETSPWVAEAWAGGVIQLASTAEDRRQARVALLGLLAGEADASVAERLAGGLARLDPTEQDKRQAREGLLALLAGQTDGSAAAYFAGGLARLDPTEQDKRQAREGLLALLAGDTHGPASASLVDEVVQLVSTAEDKRQVRVALLALLAGQTDDRVVEGLEGGVARLDPTAEDRRQVRVALLGLLAGQTDGWAARRLVGRVVQLVSTAEDRRQVRVALLGLLAGQTDGPAAGWLAEGLVQLDPTAEDRRQAREALLGLLAGQTDDWAAGWLAEGLVQLDPTAEDRRQAREALLGLLPGLLADPMGDVTVGWPVGRVVRLALTEQDRRQVRVALLGLLAGQTDGTASSSLVDGVVQLVSTAEDRRQVRVALLGLLAGQADGSAVMSLADGVIRLDPTAEDKRRVRVALLGFLAREARGFVGAELADGVIRLDPTAEDKRQARDALLALLAGDTDGPASARLVGGVVQLVSTAEDKRQARDALIGLLAGHARGQVAAELVDGVFQLDPTIRDLITCRTWAVRPTAELLGAARRNSTFADWMAGLPSLSSLSSRNAPT